jgi:hypothetical protein
MTNPTSNFGWQMPTSTDLVTDLPADFEVFGQAVDTSLAELKGGTTGQVLSKTSNTNMDFTWIDAQSGKVKQVVSTVLATTFSASSGSFTDVTGLSLSITPTSASSKILVFYNVALFVDGNLGFMNLNRGATALSQGTAQGNRTVATGGTPNYLNYAPTQAVAGNFLDSPATTSATTYKIQVYTSSGTIYVNRSAADDDQSNRPRFASVITAMEIGA